MVDLKFSSRLLIRGRGGYHLRDTYLKLRGFLLDFFFYYC